MVAAHQLVLPGPAVVHRQRPGEEVRHVPHPDAADAQLPVEDGDDLVSGGSAEQEVVGAVVHVGERGVALVDPPVEERRVVRGEVSDEGEARRGDLAVPVLEVARQLVRGEVGGGEEQRGVDRGEPVEGPQLRRVPEPGVQDDGLVEQRLGVGPGRARRSGRSSSPR